MKTSFLFLLSFLQFSIPQTQAKEAQNPLFDVNGTTIQQGFKYYVVPVDPDQAGLGFNLFSIGSEKRCPKSVFQAEPYYRGCLIALHLVDPVNTKDVIHEHTYLNIQIFYDNYTTPCPEPNFWTVNVDPLTPDDVARYITTGGEKGGNWFKIVETEKGYYKFVYCSRVGCEDVGTTEESDNRLVLGGKEFEFTFRRAETLEESFGESVPLPRIDGSPAIAPSGYDMI